VTAALVLDSSAIVALLVDGGQAGDWVASTVRSGSLAAPELAMFETANVLRRLQLAGRLERVEATLAHQDLQSLPLELWPYLPLADRAWELRETLTAYDASYVSLAELLDAPLITLDTRLNRASGPNCSILTPPDPS
jgi:predicted nucleic acid-binding protein